MSHEATNRAVKPRGLKPTTKIMLWHFCERFNTDFGGLPSQNRSAHDWEIIETGNESWRFENRACPSGREPDHGLSRPQTLTFPSAQALISRRRGAILDSD